MIDQNIEWSNKASSDSTAFGIGAGATGVATAAAIPALVALGPVGWVLGGLVGGGAAVTQLVLSIVATSSNSPYYLDVAQKITKELDDLKTVFRTIKTSNNTALENELKEKIRKIITNINKLSGNIINFDDFDMRRILSWGY
ncbi:hypothetical protein [Mesomycoplasma ovipneumoniae]|uniref:hypothetical protein n=1 Tax=Mesomycoplasma ovipneumoniae TaxID=29562 RepID=UPI002964F12E|nr:hypothetical protein [Mesomycoplasma ovipneumoniae]MDW2891277.1 hypothetical protein [Mesomycoplasma ovipneumoniae]